MASSFKKNWRKWDSVFFHCGVTVRSRRNTLHSCFSGYGKNYILKKTHVAFHLIDQKTSQGPYRLLVGCDILNIVLWEGIWGWSLSKRLLKKILLLLHAFLMAWSLMTGLLSKYNSLSPKVVSTQPALRWLCVCYKVCVEMPCHINNY